MALVFPFVMLTMSMAGAAMGGGVSSAIARAPGAGDRDRAENLATHAFLIAIFFGLVFMLVGGRQLLELLGGRGDVLEQATAYSRVYFGRAVLIWLVNILAGILRSTGEIANP
jgi:Na+-driven multidrug efflux pump